MNQQCTASVLASYATLKSLSDDKKYQGPYQMLREFIRYIIISGSLYSFTSVEMKNLLAKHFGFSIPEAVVKTSLKNMNGVSLDHGTYSVSGSELDSNSIFQDKKKEADDYESLIIQQLAEYICNRTGDLHINDEMLTEELTRFLTEDVSPKPGKYTDLIGEFILTHSDDKKIQEGLDRIREGSILYMGLCYNIGETGSITKPLTLYLGTEILFSLAGYNGEIFHQFACDFFEQVRLANTGATPKIVLRYFADIKKEIDDFFNIACEIVEGKRYRLLDKPAMKAITNGCNTSADVDIKKSDFYHLLQFSFGIAEDPNNDYYGEEFFSSNLESFDYEDETDKDKKKELAVKLISHINKLRNGNSYNNDIESEYLIVTNTKATLLISKEQSDIIKESKNWDHICNFAVSLDRITSLLWYKLGNGFARKSIPSSVTAVLKARVVLSSSIAKNAEKAFSEIKKQFEAGTLSESQVAARIITLKKKPSLPEELSGDNIEEIMDFSPEYLCRFEEEFKNSQDTIKEKDALIESIKADSQRVLLEKNSAIASKDGIIEELKADAISKDAIIQGKNDENAKMSKELERYHLKEAEENRQRQRRTNILKFLWSLLWKVGLIVVVTVGGVLLENKYQSKIPLYIGSAVGILGTILTAWTAFKSDKEKYFPSQGNTNGNAQNADVFEAENAEDGIESKT